jgi:hypothetical protein
MPFGTRRRMADVPGNEIDAYLDALEEPKRSTLTRLRDTIMVIVPDAEQCISYGMPAFRLRGKTVAGFAAFKNHPQLPAPQRIGDPSAWQGARGLHLYQRVAALSGRPAPSGGAGEEAPGRPDGGGVRRPIAVGSDPGSAAASPRDHPRMNRHSQRTPEP